MSRATAQASSNCRHTVFLHQGKHPQDAADTGLSLPVIQQLAELARLGAGMSSSPQQLRRAQRHFLGVIFFLDAISAALLTQMLAKKLVGVRMQDAHVQRIPLHFHRTPDPSRRQAVIGGFDFHTTIQMHYTFSVLVVAERFQRQCLQVRFFFREHRGNLAFGGAMDARVGPAFFPAVEIPLRFFQALEAHPFERGSLGVADPRFHFPFAIRILDPARQRHHAVVREHISKQWVDGGIVDVGNRYTFPQVVQNDHSRGTT